MMTGRAKRNLTLARQRLVEKARVRHHKAQEVAAAWLDAALQGHWEFLRDTDWSFRGRHGNSPKDVTVQ